MTHDLLPNFFAIKCYDILLLCLTNIFNMSDVPPSQYIFDTKLTLQSPCLKYAARLTENTAFAVDIPYPLLKAWNEFLSQTPAEDGEEEEEFVDSELCERPITYDKFMKAYARSTTVTQNYWNLQSLEVCFLSKSRKT